MSVLTLAGRPIDWTNPPAATARVQWSQKTGGGKPVTGSLRTIAHLDHLNDLAVKRWGRGIVVIQPPYNAGVKASAGTHDYDACSDLHIPDVGWRDQETWLRANGYGCWWRRPPAFGHHIHGFTLPPREGRDVNDDWKIHGFKVGRFVDGGWSTLGRKAYSSQIGDYYARRTGLAGHALDSGSTFPENIEATVFDLDAWVRRQRGDTPPPKPPKGLRIDGVDLSRWQSGRLDFAKAKAAGVKWVAHKATEGATWRDPMHDQRRKEVAAVAGLGWMAYHFAQPGTAKGDAAAEAGWFLSVAKPRPGDDLGPVLDLEVTNGLPMDKVRAWAREFSDTIHAAIGVRPIIYTQSSWDLGELEKTHLIWRARYNLDNRPPARDYVIHQFSGGAEAPGTPSRVDGLGSVDLNHMLGGLTVDDLRIPAPAPDPKPKPKPKPSPEGIRMRLAMYPGQHSDSADQQADDIRRVLTRARKRGVLGVTITEAGHSRTNALPGILRAAGAEHGWHVTNPPGQDCAILLDVEQIDDPGDWRWREAVAKNAAGRRHSARGALTRTFVPSDRRLGPEVSLIATHLLTGGRKPGDPNWALNQAITAEVGRTAAELGRGHRLAFVGGDFNQPTDMRDPLAGQPVTLAPIALGHHPATGPGGQPIDAIGSYDGDGRAKPAAWQVLSGAFPVPDARGRKTPLNTDHAGWCEATYRVRPL